jgi:hypothetical protein
MKTIEITLKNGKKYTGVSNGKIYGGKVYLNRPANGFIIVIENGQSFESARKDMVFETNEILTAKAI